MFSTLPLAARDVTGTWLDVFNFLDEIPGPPFLFWFLLWSAAVIITARLASVLACRALELAPTDQPVALDYLELAYLRGRRKAVVEAALCNLYRMGVIRRDLKAEQRPSATEREDMDPLESAIYAACQSHIGADILEAASLRSTYAWFEHRARERLHELGLLPRGTTLLLWFLFGTWAFVMTEGLAGVRLARSLMRGHTNVLFLVLLMGFILFVFVRLFSPRTSGAGEAYLKKIKKQFQPLVRRVQAKTHTARSAEVVYAVAACGAATFSGTALADIAGALRPVRTGSSDGSSCSSCGGGGCGGGGCGGGGCGGGGCGGG